MSKIPATHFAYTLCVNVDNQALSDADFREFVRNTLPKIDFPQPLPPKMSNHLKSIPAPVTLAAILAWEFVGNHWSDSAAFKSIDDFARDQTQSFADRAKAIEYMGEAGMGMSKSKEEREMTDEAYVWAYLNC